MKRVTLIIYKDYLQFYSPVTRKKIAITYGCLTGNRFRCYRRNDSRSSLLITRNEKYTAAAILLIFTAI